MSSSDQKKQKIKELLGELVQDGEIREEWANLTAIKLFGEKTRVELPIIKDVAKLKKQQSFGNGYVLAAVAVVLIEKLIVLSEVASWLALVLH